MTLCWHGINCVLSVFLSLCLPQADIASKRLNGSALFGFYLLCYKKIMYFKHNCYFPLDTSTVCNCFQQWTHDRCLFIILSIPLYVVCNWQLGITQCVMQICRHQLRLIFLLISGTIFVHMVCICRLVYYLICQENSFFGTEVIFWLACTH